MTAATWSTSAPAGRVLAATLARIGVVAATHGSARFVASLVEERAAGPATGSESFDLAGELLGAVVVGVTLVALAQQLDATRAQRAAILALLGFASVVAVMIEGSAFAPSLSPVERLPLGILLQLGVSAVSAGVAVAVAPGRLGPAGEASPAWPASPAPLPPMPAAPAFVRGVGAGATAYVIAYLVSGALMYLLVTGPYYETHAGGLDVPAPSIVFVIAILEGLLMALATVPLARALPGSTWRRGVVCGLSLWALGGVAPLLQQWRLPDVIRVASAVEIVFQKVPLGIVIARRFRR